MYTPYQHTLALVCVKRKAFKHARKYAKKCVCPVNFALKLMNMSMHNETNLYFEQNGIIYNINIQVLQEGYIFSQNSGKNILLNQ